MITQQLLDAISALLEAGARVDVQTAGHLGPLYAARGPRSAQQLMKQYDVTFDRVTKSVAFERI